MECFGRWAITKKLKPSETAYFIRSKGPKRKAIFSKSRKSDIEEFYATNYISPSLSEKKQKQLKEKLEKPPELIVYMVTRDTQCSHCKELLLKGSMLFVEDNPLCLNCAGFGDLVFLESGDPKLTRRAKKYSDRDVVVVKFSQARKRYERQDIFVTKAALQKAYDDISAEVN